MLIADSHEFIELYRGDKDLRMGVEMLRIDDSLSFVSFAPDTASPSDRERFGKSMLLDIGLPVLPERFDLRLLPSVSVRFERAEAGGVFSLMRGYGRALRETQPDIIIESVFTWLTPRSYQTALYAARQGVPVVYYDPGDDVCISMLQRIMAVWESAIVRRAGAIITYNDAGRDRFVRKYGYPDERIHVIPKPIDVVSCIFDGDTGPLRAAYGVGADGFVVSYVGRLIRLRGSHILLDAAQRALEADQLKNVRFVFVGGAVASSESAQAYALPNTHVTGMAPHSEVPQHLAAADVVVFPDITNPGGFPTAVAEAMAAGKAMVVGIGRHTRFLPLRDRENALLVPPSDPEAILSAVLELQQDRDLRQRIGQAAGEYARRYMDYSVVAARYLDILRDVIGIGALR